MTGSDIRWQQRFGNSQQRPLSDLERQGLIKVFEFTHELSWKTLMDFLVSHGVSDLFGSRDTTREAFSQGLISSAHTYDEATVLEIVAAVVSTYLGAFEELESRLQAQEALP